MSEVWIVAAEAVAALGRSRTEIWARLLAGETGITPVERFSTAPYYCKSAAEIKGLKPEPDSDSRFPSLLSELLHGLPRPLPQGCTLIGATLKGAIDRQEKI
ncbi:MAG TPA: hypothetical protein ENN66_00345 [Proteobacteria bacterium]|nr:hypothetical protein [Pseudomonadota bacterium]